MSSVGGVISQQKINLIKTWLVHNSFKVCYLSLDYNVKSRMQRQRIND